MSCEPMNATLVSARSGPTWATAESCDCVSPTAPFGGVQAVRETANPIASIAMPARRNALSLTAYAS